MKQITEYSINVNDLNRIKEHRINLLYSKVTKPKRNFQKPLQTSYLTKQEKILMKLYVFRARGKCWKISSFASS